MQITHTPRRAVVAHLAHLFGLHGTNNEARKVPPNAVLANNSIILRLNHSKLTHFRRRQRHINYDSDVPKQAGSQPGGGGGGGGVCHTGTGI